MVLVSTCAGVADITPSTKWRTSPGTLSRDRRVQLTSLVPRHLARVQPFPRDLSCFPTPGLGKMATSQPPIEAPDKEALVNRNPHRNFAAVEASRPDYDPSGSWNPTKAPVSLHNDCSLHGAALRLTYARTRAGSMGMVRIQRIGRSTRFWTSILMSKAALATSTTSS